MKPTRIKTWDYVLDATRHVHLLGSGLAPSDDCKELVAALDQLCKINLPLDAIEHIGRAIEKAWLCGKHGSEMKPKG